MDADPANYDLQAFEVGRSDEPVSLDALLTDLLRLVAERNPDFYELDGNALRPAS